MKIGGLIAPFSEAFQIHAAHVYTMSKAEPRGFALALRLTSFIMLHKVWL
jgi:hypothetical protein